MFLRAQIDFENGEGHQILGESYECEKRTAERGRVKTEWTVIEEEREK